jgi:hypothetical protein
MAGSAASPQGKAMRETCSPYRSAMCANRLPKWPIVIATTCSPGEKRLTIAHSCPPVPEAGKVSTGEVVWNTYCRRAVTRRRIAANSGPRWLITGRASSANTTGGTGVGPGMRRFCAGNVTRGSTCGMRMRMRCSRVVVVVCRSVMVWYSPFSLHSPHTHHTSPGLTRV